MELDWIYNVTAKINGLVQYCVLSVFEIQKRQIERQKHKFLSIRWQESTSSVITNFSSDAKDLFALYTAWCRTEINLS